MSTPVTTPEFLDLLSHVTGMPRLLTDDELVGGGIHQTGPRGHLDVHVDFNYIKERDLHRRLNILIYFNKNWQPEWGGNIGLTILFVCAFVRWEQGGLYISGYVRRHLAMLAGVLLLVLAWHYRLEMYTVLGDGGSGGGD